MSNKRLAWISVFKNKTATPENRRPALEGVINIKPDQEQDMIDAINAGKDIKFSLWQTQSKNGHTYYSGGAEVKTFVKGGDAAGTSVAAAPALDDSIPF